MKSILSTVKSRYIRGISERTARLDPDERRALADEVEAALSARPPTLPQTSDDARENTSAGASSVGASVPPESAAGGAASTVTEQTSASGDGERSVVDATDAALAELDGALAESWSKLTELEQAERFVGVRCRRYKIALENRAAELERLGEISRASARSEGSIRNEEDEIVNVSDGGAAADAAPSSAKVEPDVEEGKSAAPITLEELEKMRGKQAKDDEALTKVVETHAMMLANVEKMRRTIADLERKREEIVLGRNMCHEFLAASEEAEEMDAMGDGMAGRGGCPLALGWGPVGAPGDVQHPEIGNRDGRGPAESGDSDGRLQLNQGRAGAVAGDGN